MRSGFRPIDFRAAAGERSRRTQTTRSPDPTPGTAKIESDPQNPEPASEIIAVAGVYRSPPRNRRSLPARAYIGQIRSASRGERPMTTKKQAAMVWMNKTFGDDITTALDGTPIPPKLLIAIRNSGNLLYLAKALSDRLGRRRAVGMCRRYAGLSKTCHGLASQASRPRGATTRRRDVHHCSRHWNGWQK